MAAKIGMVESLVEKIALPVVRVGRLVEKHAPAESVTATPNSKTFGIR
jgi:hypothetical protein